MKSNDHPPEFPEIYQSWMRIRNKMNVMESLPRTFGVDKTLFLSEIHTIQAIGNTKDNNIRIIAGILGVTPSAASQMVTRLKKKGLVKKIRGVRNEREISLILTPAGKIAYSCHEKIHEKMYERIAERIGTLGIDECMTLARVFCAFESVYDEKIAELVPGEKSGERSS